jgi:branched-chain amino acid transport system substrate-binding protein
VYYPDCPRNLARVVPTDDRQGVVGAAFARQLGVRNVYVLHDGSIYGQGIAAVFASSATQTTSPPVVP